MMMEKNPSLKIRSKLWISLDDEVIFGLGRIRLFEAIEKTGSMSQAAVLLGMSYRAAWGKVKATEERLQLSLVETYRGNKKKGTTLTPAGKELLFMYTQFQEEAAKQIDELFEKHLGNIFQNLKKLDDNN